jgi:ComF family protein
MVAKREPRRIRTGDAVTGANATNTPRRGFRPAGPVAAHLRRLGSAAMAVVIPAHCPTCDQLVPQRGLFCPDCFARTGFITEPCCRGCGVMFAYAAQGGADRVCPGCRAAPPVFSAARAAFVYDNHAKRLILPMKHADRTDNAWVLALHMARAGAQLLRDADVLVPVPLHRRRLFQRRFNQAALLAQCLARQSRVPVLPDALARVRATPSLGDKSAAERRAAVDAAFSVRPHRVAPIRDRRVLLVDDVMTSGATANACAAVLKEAGAADVTVLVAARVPDPRLA